MESRRAVLAFQVWQTDLEHRTACVREFDGRDPGTRSLPVEGLADAQRPAALQLGDDCRQAREPRCSLGLCAASTRERVGDGQSHGRGGEISAAMVIMVIH
jgi:hypothetical protein